MERSSAGSHADPPMVGAARSGVGRARSEADAGDPVTDPADEETAARVGRSASDWVVVTLTLLIGAGEAASSGLGWPWLRVLAAAAIAASLWHRRRAPLEVLVAVAAVNLAANIVLRLAGHYLLVSGLMFAVAVYALVRRETGRRLAIGLGVIAGHAAVGVFANPNWSAVGALFFYGTPILLALAAADEPGVTVGRRPFRVGGAVLLVMALFVVSGGAFVVHQFHSYITRTRSPALPDEWKVDEAVLREAAEQSRGTHGPDGAVVHVVDYPHQLLSALSSPAASMEADVTVIDGEGFLQHDPKDPVGLRLLDFLEYAAIADVPIVKLDLKCDRVGPIIAEVRQAINEFGLDAASVHFNADVFRGPGIVENVLGARTDLSFTDAMYNLIVMELETADLVRLADEFPTATIVISSTTPRGAHDEGYSERHLEQFLASADEIRAANPTQPLVFAVRGDLGARSDPSFLAGLGAVENSYVAAWWSVNAPPQQSEIDALRVGGVTFFDLGEGEH